MNEVLVSFKWDIISWDFYRKFKKRWTSQIVLVVNNPPAIHCRIRKRCGFNSWVGKVPLEKGMATHSSILAWRIPWTEEPGGL